MILRGLSLERPGRYLLPFCPSVPTLNEIVVALSADNTGGRFLAGYQERENRKDELSEVVCTPVHHPTCCARLVVACVIGEPRGKERDLTVLSTTIRPFLTSLCSAGTQRGRPARRRRPGMVAAPAGGSQAKKKKKADAMAKSKPSGSWHVFSSFFRG